jgi:hypothetical protein
MARDGFIMTSLQVGIHAQGDVDEKHLVNAWRNGMTGGG